MEFKKKSRKIKGIYKKDKSECLFICKLNRQQKRQEWEKDKVSVYI